MCRNLYVIKGKRAVFLCENVGELAKNGLKFDRADDDEDMDCLCGINVEQIAADNGMCHKWLPFDDVIYASDIEDEKIPQIVWQLDYREHRTFLRKNLRIGKELKIPAQNSCAV